MKQKTTIKFQNHHWVVSLRDEVDESVAAEIFRWREYRSAEKIMTNAKTIIDAGAHIGLFALYALALNPTAKIICLEPEPNNLLSLKQNLKNNKISSVKVIGAALAGQSGPRSLAVTPDNHNHHLVSDTLSKSVIAVTAINLPDLLKRQKINQVDLLKMDIEGAEYEIIAQLRAADFAKIQNLILEYHENSDQKRQEIEAALRRAGFSVSIFPSNFDKNMGFLLAKNKR